MKNLKILALAFIAVLTAVSFASCGDDEETTSGSNALVGIWEITHSEGYEMVDGEKETEWNLDINANTVATDNYQYIRMEYGTDGKAYVYLYNSGSWSKVATPVQYRIDGNTLFTTDAEDGEITKSTFKVSDSTLTLESTDSYTKNGEACVDYDKITFKKVK